MGKSTIVIAILNSFLYVYQRVLLDLCGDEKTQPASHSYRGQHLEHGPSEIHSDIGIPRLSNNPQETSKAGSSGKFM